MISLFIYLIGLEFGFKCLCANRYRFEGPGKINTEEDGQRNCALDKFHLHIINSSLLQFFLESNQVILAHEIIEKKITLGIV